VREMLPDAIMTVDCNQSFDRPTLEGLLPTLVACNVSIIEQPFAVGSEHLLDGLGSPIPVAADESAQNAKDISELVGRFDIVNIKLDKCGGLSAGISMLRTIQAHGMKVYIGNMLGTSLAIAPAFHLAQAAEYAELDGPLFLASDRSEPVSYKHGLIDYPTPLWGYPNK
jgi:L-Ala-D/L-Glu epimerase